MPPHVEHQEEYVNLDLTHTDQHQHSAAAAAAAAPHLAVTEPSITATSCDPYEAVESEPVSRKESAESVQDPNIEHLSDVLLENHVKPQDLVPTSF